MYQGIADLRNVGEELEYTPEMIEEVIKCKEDIIYFAEKYFNIVTIDEGKRLIDLYDYQKKMLKAFTNTPPYKNPKTGSLDSKRHLIIKIARQSGKCVYKDSIIKIRNKKTGKMMDISIEKFYDLVKSYNFLD